MPRTSLSLGVVLITCGALPTAEAVTAAAPEQMLCNNSVVLTATILGGLASECMPRQAYCSPNDFVDFSLRVHAVLAVTKDARVYREGDIVSARTRLALVSLTQEPIINDGMGNFIINSRGQALSQQEVASLFGGKTYIFGLFVFPDGTTWMSVWDLQHRPWIEDTLRRRAGYRDNPCPTLLK